MRLARHSIGPSDPRPHGLFDFHAQEEVESRPQHADRRDLPDFVPGGRDRGAQNIGRELEEGFHQAFTRRGEGVDL